MSGIPNLAYLSLARLRHGTQQEFATGVKVPQIGSSFFKSHLNVSNYFKNKKFSSDRPIHRQDSSGERTLSKSSGISILSFLRRRYLPKSRTYFISWPEFESTKARQKMQCCIQYILPSQRMHASKILVASETRTRHSLLRKRRYQSR